MPDDSLTSTVATVLSHGDSVLMLETHDTTHENVQMLDTPDRLKIWAASGMKHLVLEMDAPNADLVNTMVEAHKSAEEIAQQLHARMYPLEFARAYSQLAIDAHEIGIRIEGGDHMEAALDNAVNKLSQSDKGIFHQAMQKEISARTPHEQEVMLRAVTLMVQDRESADGIQPVASDQEITESLAKNLHGDKFVGVYGGAHMLGENDLNEMLSKATGRRVRTIAIDGSEVGRKIIDTAIANHQAVDVPDFRYDPGEDKTHPLPGGHTTDPTCFRIEDWEKACHQADSLEKQPAIELFENPSPKPEGSGLPDTAKNAPLRSWGLSH